MFEELVAQAVGSRDAVGAVGAWARAENAACARRLAACADVLERHVSADGSAERENWSADNWNAAAAEIAAAQGVSLGVASHQLVIAWGLRKRLPKVAEVFAAGAVSYRMVEAIESRTRLVRDAEANAKIDAEIAARVEQWAGLSVAKIENAIDFWVDRYDPFAVRHAQTKARGRHVDVHVSDDGSGTAYVDALLMATDAEAFDRRLDAMAAAVCEDDPRTIEQRRADAMGALGHGADRLACACGRDDCEAAQLTVSSTVIHVVAREESLSDDTDVDLDGEDPPGPSREELLKMTVREALSPRAEDMPSAPADTDPAYLLGRGILPAPLLAAKLAGAAQIKYVRHPGDAPPEPRHRPSTALAWFVRCRDLTCRFPGCDVPADHCDIDHTIAYPAGPTQASNLKCLCRKHHLIKTFWAWREVQHPDGRVDWTSPTGHTVSTCPGAELLFPALCRPTAPVDPAIVRRAAEAPTDSEARGLMMPRRKRTRAQDRAAAIDEERELNAPINAARLAERDEPPPF
ncbi:HNH endonuclease signature motif containing protein [Mycolicibacterium rutilum]|nr:HNH endonuclease signature motif containing protein [Mycolicibacterium rutilum]